MEEKEFNKGTLRAQSVFIIAYALTLSGFFALFYFLGFDQPSKNLLIIWITGTAFFLLNAADVILTFLAKKHGALELNPIIEDSLRSRHEYLMGTIGRFILVAFILIAWFAIPLFINFGLIALFTVLFIWNIYQRQKYKKINALEKQESESAGGE